MTRKELDHLEETLEAAAKTSTGFTPHSDRKFKAWVELSLAYVRKDIAVREKQRADMKENMQPETPAW